MSEATTEAPVMPEVVELSDRSLTAARQILESEDLTLETIARIIETLCGDPAKSLETQINERRAVLLGSVPPHAAHMIGEFENMVRHVERRRAKYKVEEAVTQTQQYFDELQDMKKLLHRANETITR